MIDFRPLEISRKQEYDRYLLHSGERGCEYSFTNLYLWGRQMVAVREGCILFFSQFNRKSVYLFPVGKGNLQTAIDAVIADAAGRGIPCRLTGLTQDDCAMLERLYPGRFRYHFDRDSFDYIYAIDDLAELKGRRFQKKRNHLNRFWQERSACKLQPITEENVPAVKEMVDTWYAIRLEQQPHGDYHMEKAAIYKALNQWQALGLEGLILTEDEKIIAMTVGSRLSEDTFDIHFEKALNSIDGAYAAINQGFASYLRQKYPQLRWLNREDDMGLEGLRKAKMSYCPDRMIEKSWVCLLEDGYDY